MALPNQYVQKQITASSVFHISRSSYYFAGPGSPANRRYNLSDFEGIYPGTGPHVGAPWTPLASLNLGTPVAAVTTYVVNAQAVAGAGTVTLNAANTGPTPYGLQQLGFATVLGIDVERTLQYVSSNVGDTTQTITVFGTDQYFSPMHEQITLNGTTIVHGKKAFLFVFSVTASAALAGTLSVGTDTKLGLPVAVDAGGFVSAFSSTGAGNQATDAGTFVFADRTNPATFTTGDVCATYTPAAALNGTTTIFVNVFPAMGNNNKTNSTFGLPQV